MKSRRILQSRLRCAVSVAIMAFGSPILAFEEAPILAEQVAAGTLPAVEDRLPETPYVQQIVDQIGEYGGTWRRAIRGGGDQHNFVRTIGYHNLMRWSTDWTKLEPHIAESVSVNDASTEFTFALRKGMKWSDGDPFDADDIMFWYEDVLLNKALTKGIDPLWAAGGEPVVVEKIDQNTVVFKFSSPYATFLERIAYGFGAPPTLYPRHYLEQFHNDYNADGIAALVEAEPAAEDWISLFNLKMAPSWRPTHWQNPDRPTLHAWKITNAYGSANRVIAERNPYYFGVDPEGNQLPYIDKIVYDQVDDAEVILLKALSGELDYQFRHINSPDNKAILLQNAEDGDYRLFSIPVSGANRPTVYFNLSIMDPVKREVFNNREFRAALSHAIDREEIRDIVYLGQGEISQAAPRPESPFYIERLAKQHTEFDQDLANSMLDEAGFKERDEDGWRLGPDGKQVGFVTLAMDQQGSLESLEMITNAWRDVGINAQFRQVDRSFMFATVSSNEHDAYLWDAPGGMTDVITDPRGYFPFNKTVIHIAPAWADWNMNPANGEEPPAAIRAQMELYRTIDTIADAQGRIDRMKEVLEMSADQFYSIGVLQPGPGIGVARNNFKNIVDPQPYAGPLWRPAPDTVQFFMENGGN